MWLVRSSLGPALSPCLCSAAPTCASLFALPVVSGLFLTSLLLWFWADGWFSVAPWSLRVCPAFLPCALCRWWLALGGALAPSCSYAITAGLQWRPWRVTPSLLVQVLCLSQPFPPHFSHFVQVSIMASSADCVARLLHLAGLIVARVTRGVRASGNLHRPGPLVSALHIPCSQVAASPVPVPAVPFFVEPSSPGPDRVEVEVHSPPVAFPRGSVVGLASKSRPAVPPSPSPSPKHRRCVQTLPLVARASAFSPRGSGLQRRLSPSPAPVHSRQRVCARCRQVRGTSHYSPAASAVNVSVEDGVVSRGMMTK